MHVGHMLAGKISNSIYCAALSSISRCLQRFVGLKRLRNDAFQPIGGEGFLRQPFPPCNEIPRCLQWGVFIFTEGNEANKGDFVIFVYFCKKDAPDGAGILPEKQEMSGWQCWGANPLKRL